MLAVTYYGLGNTGRKAVRDQIEQLEKESFSITEMLTSTNVNLTELRDSNDKLKRKLSEMRTLIHSKAHLLSDLKAKNAELENEGADEKSKTMKLEGSVSKLEHEMQKRDTIISKLEANNRDIDGEMKTMVKEKHKLEKELHNLKTDEATLAMQGAQVDTELREELALAHGQYVELKTELLLREDAYKELEAKNADQHQHSADLAQELGSLKHQFNGMKRKFEDRDAKWRDMKKHYIEEEKTLEQLRSQLAAEEIEEQAVASERDQYLSLVDQEKELNKQLVVDLEETKEQATAWETEAESINRKLTSVEHSIKHYFQKAQGLKIDIEKLNVDRKASEEKNEIRIEHVETAIDTAAEKAKTKKKAQLALGKAQGGKK